MHVYIFRMISHFSYLYFVVSSAVFFYGGKRLNCIENFNLK